MLTTAFQFAQNSTAITLSANVDSGKTFPSTQTDPNEIMKLWMNWYLNQFCLSQVATILTLLTNKPIQLRSSTAGLTALKNCWKSFQGSWQFPKVFFLVIQQRVLELQEWDIVFMNQNPEINTEFYKLCASWIQLSDLWSQSEKYVIFSVQRPWIMFKIRKMMFFCRPYTLCQILEHTQKHRFRKCHSLKQKVRWRKSHIP